MLFILLRSGFTIERVEKPLGIAAGASYSKLSCGGTYCLQGMKLFMNVLSVRTC